MCETSNHPSWPHESGWGRFKCICATKLRKSLEIAKMTPDIYSNRSEKCLDMGRKYHGAATAIRPDTASRALEVASLIVTR